MLAMDVFGEPLPCVVLKHSPASVVIYFGEICEALHPISHTLRCFPKGRDEKFMTTCIARVKDDS